MKILFSEAFRTSLKKHQALKRSIQQKTDQIISHPLALGEPLKGQLRGYYSAAVKKNFLIIYLYCRICRKKGDQEVVLCQDCRDHPDETLKFIDFGPHDRVYRGLNK